VQALHGWPIRTAPSVRPWLNAARCFTGLGLPRRYAFGPSPAKALYPSLVKIAHAGFRRARDRVFFFGAGVERRRGWLSIAARKIRLMRV